LKDEVMEESLKKEARKTFLKNLSDFSKKSYWVAPIVDSCVIKAI